MELLFSINFSFALLMTAELVQFAYGQQSIPPFVIINESVGQSGSCPAKEQLEMSRQLITSEIVDILKSSVIPECGDGRWYRVAHLNMSDPTQRCPSAWREYSTNGTRACGRPRTFRSNCAAAFYSTTDQYNKVCGRVTGYQFGSPDAFLANGCSIDQNYLDGVNITHRPAPRRHIWSYVAGVYEISFCPCSVNSGNGSPSFVGENYYCESGNPATTVVSHLYTDDKLWDGQQCEGSCCTGTKSPPWFSVQLSAPTNDTIEVCICGNEPTDNEDTPVELIELYVNKYN